MSMTVRSRFVATLGLNTVFSFPLENTMVLILDQIEKIYLMLLHLFQLLAIMKLKSVFVCVYILDFQRNSLTACIICSGSHKTCSMNAVNLYFSKALTPALLSESIMHTRMQNTSISEIPAKDRGKVYVQGHNEVNCQLYSSDILIYVFCFLIQGSWLTAPETS